MEKRLNMMKRKKITEVLKVMASNLRLRDVLEIVAVLTLARLMRFL